ncbi:hypothetical protein [Serratia entomophila]|uniref:hypothetical protein n=1 Tax=Serratia entomophila TaxID=42906 RepID=UPI002177C3F2|nr:hypothetical protein [Serratia entomophila]CAI0876569.1 Uncharacterised protein [Serratia entomophila]CAI1783895.1 Uncharacterised protein [Serratia entomophila]
MTEVLTYEALKAERDALAVENAALKRERSELGAIGELIRTQDNRITDQPFFAVMTKREIVASEDHDCDRICWVENQSGDYVEATETQHRRLEAIYQAKYEVRDGWDRYAMKEIDVFVTGCFTEQGCKDYINKNGHNLNKPFIYAFGSYRNDEYQTVRKFIMQIPETPATDAALAAIEARSITAALDSCSEYLDTDCVMDRLGISYADAELRSIGAMELCNALKSHAANIQEAK